jgi:hypothetical protein
VRRCTRHQAIADPVQCLKVKLVVGLDRYEAHVLAGHGFGNGFGIAEIVLVRLHERLDELPRNEAHVMALVAQCRAEELCPAHASMPITEWGRFAVWASSCVRESFLRMTTLLCSSRATR